MDERKKDASISTSASEVTPGQENPAQGSEADISLEASFEKLDTLLERLEDREIPLEEAFTLYQQGVELIRRCNEKIDTVEKKILVMTGDGGFDEF
ncbi:MAG: exodeoxyribonuclease VII small subunit [Lachnospiraceae bacterium]|nr:exodeoxyribonuclease VII small subunit [Lachnospiraceae bacterium]